MRPKKCYFCDGELREEIRDFEAPVPDKDTGQPIKVPGVRFLRCTNSECNQSILTSDQVERIDLYVARRTRHTLNQEQIRSIREALPFKTKADTADFLLLNSKAFIKWENGYSEANSAYDLLLRLVAFDQRNLCFIKYLHQKQFRFDPTDYQLICQKQGLPWLYPTLSIVSESYPAATFAAETSQQFSEGARLEDANAFGATTNGIAEAS
jgi:DNA-binding transcriptional regulator YiaG